MESNLGNSEQLTEKWGPVLEHPDMNNIEDNYRKSVTAILLENQEQAIQEANGNLQEAGAGANAAGGGLGLAVANDNANMQGYDPILISLVRRAMPNLIAYDVAGVQPMTGPTGLIFAMRSKYKSQDGTEALHNEAATGFAAGASAAYAADAGNSDPLFADAGTTAGGSYAVTSGMTRSAAENLGADNAFQEMAFSIERTAVEAKTRALKAEYTTELAQDLKAVHGLDAETELANILSTEILAEINREVIRVIYKNAKLGAQHMDLAGRAVSSTSGITGATSGDLVTNNLPSELSGGRGVGGVYDVANDADGRWSAENWRGLLYQCEREANVIAKETRRGKGNFIICSADVASALAMSGFLQISPAMQTNLQVDDTGNTFAGVLNGKMKVYIDPYTGAGNNVKARDYCCVGYKGTSPYDAGLFYCPYVPLQMVRAVGENTFQPKIGFKTRYGMVNNPFVSTNTSDPHNAASTRNNQYYRIFRVDNIHGN